MKKKIITTPFDRKRIPPKQNFFLMPLIWLVCWVLTRGSGLKINKTNMKGLKPPFLVVGTHHSFTDFYVTPLTLFPYRANYISELEGFENFGEWIYRQIGCLGTRKFVSDLALIKNIKRVIARKGVMVIYPEARYANIGTSSEIPISVSKLAKMLKVPLVTLNMHGNYLESPIWNLKKRKGVKLEANLNLLYTKDELEQATVPEIHSALHEALKYDEYAWQLENNMRIDYAKRSEGLELVLYKCPDCNEEFGMQTSGADLFCTKCGSRWHMTELGQLKQIKKAGLSVVDGECEMVHMPDWYEWQRTQVIEEIKQGKYGLNISVQIDSLPNAKNFIDLGIGNLKHDKSGFYLTFIPYESNSEITMHFNPRTTYSIHTEYDYRHKGQCVTLSELDNTYFIFPKDPGFNATKIQFATEYLYGAYM